MTDFRLRVTQKKKRVGQIRRTGKRKQASKSDKRKLGDGKRQ